MHLEGTEGRRVRWGMNARSVRPEVLMPKAVRTAERRGPGRVVRGCDDARDERASPCPCRWVGQVRYRAKEAGAGPRRGPAPIQLNENEPKAPMTLDALIRECQDRQKAAEETGQMLDGAKTYASIVAKLRMVDDLPALDRVYTSEEVGLRLNLSAETIAGYCRAGRFPNAYKTSPATKAEDAKRGRGRWRIPAADVAAFIKNQSDNGAKQDHDEQDPLDEFDKFLEK